MSTFFFGFVVEMLLTLEAVNFYGFITFLLFDLTIDYFSFAYFYGFDCFLPSRTFNFSTYINLSFNLFCFYAIC